VHTLEPFTEEEAHEEDDEIVDRELERVHQKVLQLQKEKEKRNLRTIWKQKEELRRNWRNLTRQKNK
jgi:hypothetical protein